MTTLFIHTQFVRYVVGAVMDNSIRFRIDRQEKKNFQDVCNKMKINQSALLRELIIQWLEKEKKEGGNNNG